MSTSSHTPAPWEISKHATPEHSPQFGIYSGAHHHDLAIVSGANAKADATLIAAAPDMLKTLQDCETILDIANRHTIGTCHTFIIGLEKVRAAIQKATDIS